MNGENSDYVPTDGELKAAELARIKAETEEINKRLNLPWWHLSFSALLQALIGGIVVASVIVVFILDNAFKFKVFNKDLNNTLKEYEAKLTQKLTDDIEDLQIQINAVEERKKEVEQQEIALLEDWKSLEKKQQDLATRNEEVGRQEEAKKARESADEIQKKLDEQIKIQAESLIEGLKGDRRRESRKNLAQLYPKNPEIVGDSLAKAIKENFDSYRITLGVLDALGKVEGGWRESSNLIEEVEGLSQSPYIEDPTFKENLSEARNNFKQ
ncbi:hypothetical protein [Crocosphaera sp.]|uniref:hypothetical protein n=1 Tax=Crocosphaera sp. TaxID=2729996 RepID=UPI003F233D86|nr:hypothetical protein [Crocosphaera sp.]